MSLTRTCIGIATCSLVLSMQAKAQEPSELIAEAMRMADELVGAQWPSANAPFRVLLIDGDIERLYCADDGLDGFSALEDDVATGCSLQTRAAVFDPGFLATFPLADGISTIVVGTPSSTGRNPEDWVAVLVHEHLHQLQQSAPDYSELTMGLDLHDGDQTGMWMLNYPFDYDDADLGERFALLGDAAATALELRHAGGREFDAAALAWLNARAAFTEGLSDRDRRYFEFQLWQEGVARYIEVLAAIAWTEHPATPESAEAELSRELRGIDLGRDRRVAFYPLGAAEAFLLDRADPDWKQFYFDGRLALGPRLTPLGD